MARMVVLGHGGFNTKSEMVLVPKDTTVTFFSDAGSNLLLPAVSTVPEGTEVDSWVEGVNCRFDYERVADVLDQFTQTETPLVAGKVVPNMMLEAAGAETRKIARSLHDAGKWGGEMMINETDGKWWLCYGDETTCPTPKLHVAAKRHDELVAKGDAAVSAFKSWLDKGASGDLPDEIADFAPRLADVPDHMRPYVADGVPDDRWSHDCVGILGKDVGEGYDLVWVACSGFAVSQAELASIGLSEGLPSEITQDTSGPGLQWSPADADLDRIKNMNAQKVKDTPDGKTIKIRVGGLLMLIGDGHEGDAENYVRRQGDSSQGTITVKKGGAFTKGTVTVDGVPSGQQGLVEKSIGEFSDKNVVFA